MPEKLLVLIFLNLSFAMGEDKVASSSPNRSPSVAKTPSAENWGSFTLDDLKRMAPRSEAGNYLFDIPQLFLSAGDFELMEVMEGIMIETTAQVMKDSATYPQGNGLRAYVVLRAGCLIPDENKMVISIPIEFAGVAPGFEDLAKYRIVGQLHFHKEEDSEYTPILKVKSFEMFDPDSNSEDGAKK